MPRGENFRNAYWFSKGPHDADWTVLSGHSQAEPDPDAGVQGALFSPYTGTGLRQDPLVPESQRVAAVDRALGLDRPRRGRSKKDADLLRESLMSSTFPTREIEAMQPSSAYLKGGNRGGGFYRWGSRELEVGRQSRVEHERIPEQRIQATQASDTPIFNEKFKDQAYKKIWAWELFENDLDRAIDHGGQDVRWQNPETGETKDAATVRREYSTGAAGPQLFVRKKGEPEWRVRPYDRDEHGPLNELSTDPNDDVSFYSKPGSISTDDWTDRALKAGLRPNLFFGKGVDPKNLKIHSEEPFTVERDYMSSYSNTWPKEHIHTRFVPSDETVDKVIPARTVKHRTPFIRQTTLVHELGHATDAVRRQEIGQVSDTTRVHIDPLGEGRSDGIADHYSLSGTLQMGRGDLLANDITKADIEKGLSASGYTVGNSRWKNSTMRALYAAARIDTGLQGLKGQHPDRNDVLNNIGKQIPEVRGDKQQVDRFTLGHMWEHKPHIREHMPEELRAIAEQSHAEYVAAYDTHRLNEHNRWVDRVNALRPGERPLTKLSGVVQKEQFPGLEG